MGPKEQRYGVVTASTANESYETNNSEKNIYLLNLVFGP